MSKSSKQYVGFLLIVGLILAPLAHAADAPTLSQQETQEREEKDSGTLAMDILIARPLGILATVAGGAIFLVSLPVSAMTGQTRLVYDKMVREPAKYTFKRSLGEF